MALDIADEVDAYTLPRYLARDVDVDWKSNQTEVTDVDRTAEAMVVDRILAARPGHRAFGEEHGEAGEAGSRWRWVIDPIDGTSGFVRGIPVWGLLLALTYDDRPVLGVVSAPALGRRWWGGVGLGAHVSTFGETRPARVSTVADLSEAQVSITHNAGWDDLGLTGALVALQQRARRSRGFGDFWQHMLVAEGALDVAVDAVGVAEYDIAAIVPIVEAAGGRLTDREGNPTHRNGTAITTNGRLHDAVIASLR